MAFWILGAIFPAKATPLDSIGSVTINGKVYVLHQVETGESVYSIATKYGASMREIVAVSPEVKKGLEQGMVIKVPYTGKIRTTVPVQKVTPAFHIVKAGETLYAISRMYQVTVDELMKWNNLITPNLAIGQKLKISGAKLPDEKEPQKIEKGNKIHIVKPGEGLYGIARIYHVQVDDLIAWNKLSNTSLQVGQKLIVGIGEAGNYPHPVKLNPEAVSLSQRYEVEKVIESGLAALIEGTENSQKYLALHRTASIGAIIAVKNEMNGQMVFVRVVGKLPNTGVNNKVVIRISNAAYKKLGAIDPRFRVELSYLPNR